MKEKILLALQTKFAGVRADILERIATKMATKVANESDIDSAVEGVGFQEVLDSYADHRTTEGVKGAILNYEKKYGIKDGKPLEAPQPTPTPTPTPAPTDTNAMLLQAIQALTKEVGAMKQEKIVNTRQSAIQTIISELPENLRKPYARMSFDSMSDDDFNALQEEIKAEVGSIKTDLASNGTTFGVPAGGGKPQPKEASEADINAIAESLGL